MAAVYNQSAGTQKIYINGVEDVSRTYSAAINTVASPLILGGYYHPFYSFNGKLDETMLLNRALSASEVAALAGASNQARSR